MLFSWAFFASAADACVICFPFPKTTLADMLLQSKTVILARERADKPYSLYAVEVLKGAVDAGDIDAFIPSTARRKLKNNSEDVVVFRQQHFTTGWLYTAYADTEYQKFIRTIFERSSDWQKFGGESNRIEFFAERLNHRNQLILIGTCFSVNF
jgi:hypothetical protein